MIIKDLLEPILPRALFFWGPLKLAQNTQTSTNIPSTFFWYKWSYRYGYMGFS
jgi:hypothetical protein